MKYIGQQFAKPSGFGGRLSTFIMNIMNQTQYKSILKEIKINQNKKKILDIGFGNGYGKQTIKETTDFIFKNNKDVLQIKGVIASDNVHSKAMVIASGFVWDQDSNNIVSLANPYIKDSKRSA